MLDPLIEKNLVFISRARFDRNQLLNKTLSLLRTGRHGHRQSRYRDNRRRRTTVQTRTISRLTNGHQANKKTSEVRHARPHRTLNRTEKQRRVRRRLITISPHQNLTCTGGRMSSRSRPRVLNRRRHASTSIRRNRTRMRTLPRNGQPILHTVRRYTRRQTRKRTNGRGTHMLLRVHFNNRHGGQSTHNQLRYTRARPNSTRHGRAQAPGKHLLTQAHVNSHLLGNYIGHNLVNRTFALGATTNLLNNNFHLRHLDLNNLTLAMFLTKSTLNAHRHNLQQ